MIAELKNIKCFILDMDGTFYLEDKIFDGSLEFISKLKENGQKFIFLTNNSSHNQKFYIERLGKMGLEISNEQIMTSGIATAEFINNSNEFAGKKAFLLGNSYLKNELEDNNVFIDNKNSDYIIVGFDTTLTYKKMCDVCELASKGLKIIATHPDYTCPTKNGFVPDVGAILDFIKSATGKSANYIIGKPNFHIINSVLNQHNLKKSEIAMVGDRLYTDIKVGTDNNFMSILVLSGETTKDMVEKSDIKPNFIFQNLKELSKNL